MAADKRCEASVRRRLRARDGAGRWPPTHGPRVRLPRPQAHPRAMQASEHARAALFIRSRGSDRRVEEQIPAVCPAPWSKDGEELGPG